MRDDVLFLTICAAILWATLAVSVQRPDRQTIAEVRYIEPVTVVARRSDGAVPPQMLAMTEPYLPPDHGNRAVGP